MKDLIQRLEKFESDLNQLRDFLPNFFQPQTKKNRKRSLQKLPLNNNHRVSPSTLAANDKIAIKLAAFSAQQVVTIKTESPHSHDDITIEEIGPCDEEEGELSGTASPPPYKQIKRESQPTEIEVKVSDPMTPVVTPKPSPISGASRRKGASQVWFDSEPKTRRLTLICLAHCTLGGNEQWCAHWRCRGVALE